MRSSLPTGQAGAAACRRWCGAGIRVSVLAYKDDIAPIGVKAVTIDIFRARTPEP